MTALMGYREYARHRGVALRAVQKAIEAGRIPTVGEGDRRKIDPVAADAAWRANTDPAAQSLLYSAGPEAAAAAADMAAAAGAEADAAPGRAGDAADDEPAPADQTSDYRVERAKRERIRREREEIELAELRGNMVPLPAAELAVFTAFRSLRDAMLQVAARVKDRCAAATDPDVIEQVIEAEVSETLGRFDPAKMLQPSDDDEDGDDAG